MDVPITLWLSEVEAAAVRAEATAYGQDEEARVKTWIAPALSEAVRRLDHARWEARRRKLTADPALAAQVDARGVG